jgi:hypothetical protein
MIGGLVALLAVSLTIKSEVDLRAQKPRVQRRVASLASTSRRLLMINQRKVAREEIRVKARPRMVAKVAREPRVSDLIRQSLPKEEKAKAKMLAKEGLKVLNPKGLILHNHRKVKAKEAKASQEIKEAKVVQRVRKVKKVITTREADQRARVLPREMIRKEAKVLRKSSMMMIGAVRAVPEEKARARENKKKAKAKVLLRMILKERVVLKEVKMMTKSVVNPKPRMTRKVQRKMISQAPSPGNRQQASQLISHQRRINPARVQPKKRRKKTPRVAKALRVEKRVKTRKRLNKVFKGRVLRKKLNLSRRGLPREEASEVCHEQ